MQLNLKPCSVNGLKPLVLALSFPSDTKIIKRISKRSYTSSYSNLVLYEGML